MTSAKIYNFIIFLDFDRRNLPNGSGTCLNASGVFFVSNLHVEMVKTVVQTIRSKHDRIFIILGGSFGQPFLDITINIEISLNVTG